MEGLQIPDCFVTFGEIQLCAIWSVEAARGGGGRGKRKERENEEIAISVINRTHPLPTRSGGRSPQFS